MLIELTITPLGRCTHLSKDLADILKIIDESDVRYCLTPFGTCLEGEWNEVMTIVKRCHDQARSFPGMSSQRYGSRVIVSNQLVIHSVFVLASATAAINVSAAKLADDA